MSPAWRRGGAIAATIGSVLLAAAGSGLLWRHGNEVGAARMMLRIQEAEVQFQAGGYCDPDCDSVGGYGHLSQLTGQHDTNKVAAGMVALLPRDLICSGPPADLVPPATAVVSAPLHGYRFASFRADSGVPMDGSWVWPRAERWEEFFNAGERQFLCVAWPERYGITGRLSFAIRGDGELLAADIVGAASADAVAVTFFGSAAQALDNRPHRPGTAMSKADVAAFTGSRVVGWWEALRARIPWKP